MRFLIFIKKNQSHPYGPLPDPDFVCRPGPWPSEHIAKFECIHSGLQQIVAEGTKGGQREHRGEQQNVA